MSTVMLVYRGCFVLERSLNSSEFIPSSFHVFLVLCREVGLKNEEYLQLDEQR